MYVSVSSRLITLSRYADNVIRRWITRLLENSYFYFIFYSVSDFSQDLVITVFALLCKMTGASAWIVLMIYTLEIYPSGVRYTCAKDISDFGIEQYYQKCCNFHSILTIAITLNNTDSPFISRTLGFGLQYTGALVGSVVAPQIKVLVTIVLKT